MARLSEEALSRKDRRAKTPSMQHRHFAFIASVISGLPLSEREGVAWRFAYALNRTNHAFDMRRFVRACDCKGERNVLLDSEAAASDE